MAKARILIGKIGLDGHDRGAIFLCRVLRDAGYEVIYTGLYQTPAQIAAAAVQEDVDMIGLSILSGAHLGLTKKLMDELKKRDAAEKRIIIGGLIFEAEINKLLALGVEAVFPSYECTFEDILKWLEGHVPQKASGA